MEVDKKMHWINTELLELIIPDFENAKKRIFVFMQGLVCFVTKNNLISWFFEMSLNVFVPETVLDIC